LIPFDIRRFAETRFSPNESALIGLRFSEASLVTAAGQSPRQGQERWKEMSVDRLLAAKIVTSGESQGRPAHYLHS
jgi:hypothetical protein